MEEYEDSEEGQKSKVNDAKIDKVSLNNSRIWTALVRFPNLNSFSIQSFSPKLAEKRVCSSRYGWRWRHFNQRVGVSFTVN